MSCFLSPDQIAASAEQLNKVHPFFGIAFLVFKLHDLPVGSSKRFVVSRAADDFLNRYFRLHEHYPGYYQPFQTSDPNDRWVKQRYASTSLQRITTDTFGDALLHVKGTSQWGWRPDYIDRLKRHLGSADLPAFDLAVWFCRSDEWSEAVRTSDVCDRFYQKFKITPSERDTLFSSSADPVSEWTREQPASDIELLDIVGEPAGLMSATCAALESLTLEYVGPARRLRYEPAARVNMITGDNSLGKTFLLECIWWALTGDWHGYPAAPRRQVSKARPQISFQLGVGGRSPNETTVKYDWNKQTWRTDREDRGNTGLILYGRHDGAFAICDPARAQVEAFADVNANKIVRFSREEVWSGKRDMDTFDRVRSVCNGLIVDWVKWQTGGDRYASQYQAFLQAIETLSPSTHERLTPGEPTRFFPLDSREIPTLKMPYGDVPILHASAGVQRIVALAYLVVWSWHEHLATSRVIRREPQHSMAIILDEIEAHLHPRWQRQIVPALLRAISEIGGGQPQVHLATHSPMVLASAEPVFDAGLDSLHHLRFDGDNVVLDNIPFVKRGRVDLWLVSDVFGLAQARSLPAEEAIEDAKQLQQMSNPPTEKVRHAHEALVKVLAPDDDYWPRWLYFAKKHGLNNNDSSDTRG